MSIRLMVCGVCLQTAICVADSLMGSSLSAGLFGLMLTLSSDFSDKLSWSVRTFTRAERMMSSVERIFHYTNTQPEPSVYDAASSPSSSVSAPQPSHTHHSGDELDRLLDSNEGDEVKETEQDPPQQTLSSPSFPLTSVVIDHGWPSEGKLEFRDVCMRYRAHLDDVLCHVSFVIRPQEKIGVVGRTGKLPFTHFPLFPFSASCVFLSKKKTRTQNNQRCWEIKLDSSFISISELPSRCNFD